MLTSIKNVVYSGEASVHAYILRECNQSGGQYTLNKIAFLNKVIHFGGRYIYIYKTWKSNEKIGDDGWCMCSSNIRLIFVSSTLKGKTEFIRYVKRTFYKQNVTFESANCT